MERLEKPTVCGKSQEAAKNESHLKQVGSKSQAVSLGEGGNHDTNDAAQK